MANAVARAEVSEARQLLLYWANHPEMDVPYDETMTEEVFVQRAATISRLHMFMHNCSDLAPLSDFCALRELVVTLQTIPRMEGLHNCRLLERLVLTEVKLDAIAGLQNCVRLRQLDLSRNRIRRIVGLGALANLETLWLNENQISRIEGLEANTRLRTLWIARNRIASIGESLDGSPQLRELNIAANQISTFRDIPNLARLRRLRSLTTSDPHYGPNPVCALYNYTTYCLCNLPQLTSLDQAAVSAEARALAEGTYAKKAMYYSMRIKAAQRLHAAALQRATDAKQERAAQLALNLNVLLRQRADASYALHCAAGGRPVPRPAAGGASAAEHGVALRALGELGGAAGEQLAAKLLAVDRALDGKARELSALELAHEAFSRRADGALAGWIGRLLLELESGGNVRLEDGGPAEVWHSSCADLLHSRFYALDFAGVGLESVRALRVARVHNRALRSRFDERIDALAEAAGGGGGGAESGSRRALEYLFALPCAPAAGGVEAGGAGGAEAAGSEVGVEATVLLHAEHGLALPHPAAARGGEDGQGGGEDAPAAESACPVLCNSMSLLDLPRLAQALLATQHPNPAAAAASAADAMAAVAAVASPTVAAHVLGESGALHGELLVCKAHLGKCVPEDPELTRKRGGKVLAVDYPGAQSVFRVSADDARQRQWFVFEPELVLVEYVLAYEYVARGSRLGDAEPPAELTCAEVGGLAVDELGALAHPLASFLRKCCLGAGLGADGSGADGGVARAQGSRARGAAAEYDADCAAALAMPPAIAARAQSASLSALALSEAAAQAERAGSGPAELLLDAHGCGLRSVPSLGAPAAVGSLRSLVLSFNSLEKVPPLSGCSLLESLDLSFNLLRSTAGLSGLAESGAQLRRLDLSANLLHRADDVQAIARCCAHSLRALALRGNALAEQSGYRLSTVRRLPVLAELDLVPVTQPERLRAKRAAHEPSGHGDGADRDGGEARGALSEAALQACAFTLHTPSLAFGYSAVRPRSVAQLLAAGIPLPRLSRARAEARSGANGSDDDEEPEEPEEPGAGGRRRGPARWEGSVEQLQLAGKCLGRVPPLGAFVQLRALDLSRNELASADALGGGVCPLLRELRMEANRLTSIDGLGGLSQLRRVELGHNQLTELSPLSALASLSQLGIEGNLVASLAPLANLLSLSEVYAASNRVARLSELNSLRELPRLIILDLAHNALCADKDYRSYALFALRRLKVLDSLSVEGAEQAAARERFTGLLTADILAERTGLPQAEWRSVSTLDLSGCKLRELSLLSARTFPGLRELSLAANQLSSLVSLGSLPQLVALSLAGNALGSAPPTSAGGRAAAAGEAQSRALERLGGVSSRLERLDLSANQLAELEWLPLHGMPLLRVLRLGSNELVRLNGGALERLSNLRELSLEKNRIRLIEHGAFAGLHALLELRLDDNALRSLDHIGPLPALELLTLGGNRVSEVAELDKLTHLGALRAIACAANPVSRKQLYRPTLIRRLGALEAIDGRHVSPEERERVELVFAGEARLPAALGQASGGALGGNGGPGVARVALKQTSLSFDLFGPPHGAPHALLPAQQAHHAHQQQHSQGAHGGWPQGLAGGVLGVRIDGDNGARFGGAPHDDHARGAEALAYASGALRKGPTRPGSNSRRATYTGPGAAASSGEERARVEPRQAGGGASLASVSGRRMV